MRSLAAGLTLVGTLSLSYVSGAENAADAERAALLDRAKQHAWNKRFVAARGLLDQILSRNGRDDEARAWLARIDAWDGKLAAAERVYRELHGRHPNDVDVAAGLVDVLLWQSKVDEASKVLETALRKEQHNVELLERKARIAYAQGRLDDARSVADEAVALGGTSASLQDLRANLYLHELRLSLQYEAFPDGFPNLPGFTLSYARRWNAFTTVFSTTQETKFSTTTPGSRQYNGSYGLVGTFRATREFEVGAQLGFGLPARAVPDWEAGVFASYAFGQAVTPRLSYSYRDYPAGRSLHVLHPSVSVGFGGLISLEPGYWLSFTSLPSGSTQATLSDVRAMHAFGLAVVVTPVRSTELGGVFVHGAQVEVDGESGRFIELQSDALGVWVQQLFSTTWGGRVGVGAEHRQTDVGFAFWLYRGEFGVFRRW